MTDDVPSDAGAGTPDDAAPPLADETRKLLVAVQQWAQRAMPAPPSGHGGPECQWCPLCQLASILRGERPDVAERLTEAGTALSAVLRAVVDGARTSGSAATDDDPRRPSPSPRVQRVHFDETDREA